MSTSYQVTITRTSDWDESYDLYYRIGSAPVEIGDGVYEGNHVIRPDQTSITFSVVIPATVIAGFIAAPVQARECLTYGLARA
jgi:hypothetical protein